MIAFAGLVVSIHNQMQTYIVLADLFEFATVFAKMHPF
jgi:hypothetical protein